MAVETLQDQESEIKRLTAEIELLQGAKKLREHVDSVDCLGEAVLAWSTNFSIGMAKLLNLVSQDLFELEERFLKVSFSCADNSTDACYATCDEQDALLSKKRDQLQRLKSLAGEMSEVVS